MKINDEMFQSLSRMAEEYDRLVSPLTKQLGIYDRWLKITSPILRVAEMRDDVFRGIIAFDMSLAHRLSLMTEPYKSMLDNMAAIESMMGTRFSELVQPQIYVPGIAAGLTTFASASARLGKKVQIAHAASGVAVVARQMAQIQKPWQTDISTISAFDSVIDNSVFSRLVGMEKAVASLSSVESKYNQMTSVSAQIASLLKVGLTDAWKRVITPSELLLGLSDFAIKQYEQIQKATDEQSIAWRLGLIDAVSKFVDAQVTWGSTLAIDINIEAPETEMAVPNLSDLPVFLGPAKRDNKDVEEAFDESQLMEIIEAGKIIIHKAKTVNDFCKTRNMSLIFPEADLLNWAMILSGSFCRDAEKLQDVLDTLSKMFIRKPIIDLIGRHRCFEDIEAHRKSTETKKKLITRFQKQIYYQIIGVEEELIKAIEGVPVTILDEDTISKYVMKALLNVQKDKLYEGEKENSINDGIRNQLSIVYEVKNQTRQGASESGKDAGEVDIMLCDNGNPVAIMEGLKLASFESGKLDIHINKVLTNYDPNGCPLVYILIYATVKHFDDFWDKIMKHMDNYSFPYEAVEGIQDIATAYTESRHAKAVLNRNGKRVSIHLYAVAMR